MARKQITITFDELITSKLEPKQLIARVLIEHNAPIKFLTNNKFDIPTFEVGRVEFLQKVDVFHLSDNLSWRAEWEEE